MKKSTVNKLVICCLLSMSAIFATAMQDKVLQIFKDGKVIKEYPVSEIDYIEVNNTVEAPTGINAVVDRNQITISWTGVDNATYNVYRSADNVNFELLASGLDETEYTDTKPFAGANYYKVSACINGMESNCSSTVAGTVIADGSDHGFYLGIIGFNNELYTYPIRYLSESSAQGYYSFIDGLTTENGTVLYYGVDKSIDNLQAAAYPDNLHDVAILTFTDGLDEGSLDETSYLTLPEYLTALNKRLTTETVSEQKMTSYTIGLIGKSVTNLTQFKKNLRDLATSPDNVFEVSNMAEVNEVFQKIADFLSETKYVQKFLLTIKGPSHNEKCRFTFDNVTSYSSSRQYIEGTFNRIDKTLTDIKYVGLTSTSGSVVPGVFDEKKFYNFTFEGLQSLDGEKIPIDHVQHWRTEGGVWEKDIEYTFDPGKAGIEKIKRSAAIMLNLDCSSSLGDKDFALLKENAKTFIRKLIENAVDPSEVASISLDRTAVSLAVGNTVTLKATVLPVTAKLKDVQWSSTNPEVATVDEKSGIVTAHKPGSATIIARTVDGGYTASCQISVIIPVSTITLNSASEAAYIGETLTLAATVHPENATDKSLIWTSSNTSVATVTKNGKIIPLSAGQTVIKATANDGHGANATCTVRILQHVGSVDLDHKALTLNIGASRQLKATVSPDNASDKTVTWSSSDTRVATVDNNGLVKAISRGSARITATSKEGNKTAACEVEVRQFVEKIVIDKPTASLNIGESLQLTAAINPADADNKTIKWSISDPSIASVSQNGLVQGVTPGSATITVAAQDGSGVKATSTVTVRRPVTAISLNSSSLNLDLGNTGTLSVVLTPENASNTDFAVESSNTSVATVTKNGRTISVKTVGIGTSTITVSSQDGNHTATCNVTVSLSRTPANLALAIKKGGVRYYIPESVYSSDIMPVGYTKEGVTVSNGTTTFVLALNDATSATKTFSEANALGTLPTNTQGNVISQYWSAISAAATKYGGTALKSSNYWTSTSSGTGSTAYVYHPGGVGSVHTSRTYYVRCIVR
ncbi:MAG: Ig-like domain-containing protein [Bacteroidales bacterium]|nr:Ig-like domain-containing protein [Bacteroidales bacterium]